MKQLISLAKIVVFTLGEVVVRCVITRGASLKGRSGRKLNITYLLRRLAMKATIKKRFELLINKALRKATYIVAQALIASDDFDDYFFDSVKEASGNNKASNVISIGNYAIVRKVVPAVVQSATVTDLMDNSSKEVLL